MRFVVALLALFLAVPAPAQTPEEAERLSWTVERGRLLFEIDRAAWVTTDDMRERLGEADVRAVRGWTVERDGGGYAVVYYVGEGDARAAIYRGRVENSRVMSSEVMAEGARPPLTPMQRRLADARDLVRLTDARVCAEVYPNITIIPPESIEAPIDLYVLTPQVRSGTYPFGGHHRATFSAAGELLSQRRFSNNCLEMSDASQNGNRPGALMVTHLLDPIPTEIHVFMSIWIGLPVFVGTGERVWEVYGARIRLIDRN